MLIYFADPAVLLRRLVGLVKPGGIVTFHEMDMDGAKSEPACPVFETAVEWVRQTFTRADVADFMLKQLMDDTYLRKTSGVSS